MNKLISISLILVFASTLYFSSCNNSQETTVNPEDTLKSDSDRIDSLTAEKKNTIEFKFMTAEANLPSPFEIVNDIYNFHAPFREELLNDYNKAGKYLTAFKQEVNFGIYGIDLAYINYYGNNQTLLNYYLVTKKLSEKLNIQQAFSQFSNRFLKNSSNKDSVIALVDMAFNETDVYLKKNERYLSASHVLAGALIEMNYLSLNLLKGMENNEANKPLFQKVYNEKLYIYHLAKLFEEYTDKDSKDLLKDLNEFKTYYDSIIKSTDDFTPSNIDLAVSHLSEIRNKLIN